MSAAITSEQLAQLKRDAAACDFRDHTYFITEDVDEHIAEAIERMLNAAPALLAEVGRLRAIVDALSRLSLDESTMTRAQLLCLLVDLREQAGLPRVL